jgi:hypothetical protein
MSGTKIAKGEAPPSHERERENMQEPAREPPVERPRPPTGRPPPPVVIHPLEAATRRISAQSLDRSGIKTVRVLNESGFRDLLERLVEERLRSSREAEAPARAEKVERAEPRPLPVGPLDLRAEYRGRWEECRSLWEGRLQRLEERARALSGPPGPPGR